MDAQYGGLPSPIFPTEFGYQKFYPLPIPFEQSDLKYSDLHLFDDFSVWDFIKDVAPNYKHLQTCHLDPDLRQSYLKKRPAGWQRAFGQVMQAQAHLENHGVSSGDIFLFFGWFQLAEFKNGKFAYKKTKQYPNGFHAIYGYLQVDKVYKPNIEGVPEWLHEHAHVSNKGVGYFKSDNNAVYTTLELFDYPKEPFNKNGAICFTFKEDLILTQPGQQNRTVWELPSFLHPDNGVALSYNPKERWSFNGDKAVLRAAGRGQEFIFTADPNGVVEDWCINLIKNHSVTD